MPTTKPNARESPKVCANCLNHGSSGIPPVASFRNCSPNINRPSMNRPRHAGRRNSRPARNVANRPPTPRISAMAVRISNDAMNGSTTVPRLAHATMVNARRSVNRRLDTKPVTMNDAAVELCASAPRMNPHSAASAPVEVNRSIRWRSERPAIDLSDSLTPSSPWKKKASPARKMAIAGKVVKCSDVFKQAPWLTRVELGTA